MRRLLAVAIVLLLVPAIGLAKKSSKKSPPSGAFGGFGPQVALADFEGINAELREVGIEELETMHWMFGGGGWVHIGRVVLGGSGWGGSQNVSGETTLVRVDVAGGQFEAGYSILKMKHCIITPMLGIGGSGYDITVEQQGELPKNLEELLLERGPTSTVGFTGFTLTPELVFTFPVSFFGLQLKAGYGFTPAAPGWEYDGGASLINGPDVAKGTPFAAVNIVFGGMDRKSFKR
ncbi:MAG: hypothetical protein JSU73_06135 [candidate division WOR-3 bacterium]|nr:MAG: hypothetical protein JSU73_06135 [candidate division WOR-3 bacterium]